MPEPIVLEVEHALFELTEAAGALVLAVETQGQALAVVRYRLDAAEAARYRSEGRRFILNLAEDIAWSPNNYRDRLE